MDAVIDAHSIPADEVILALKANPDGLGKDEVSERLKIYGPNSLPKPKTTSVAVFFLRQFYSPLIYILLAAAAISLFLGDWQESIFIMIVLLLNSVIGTIQEYSAEKSAEALKDMVRTRTRVIRDGEEFEIDSEELVPGDIVLLESGGRVPADVRLISVQDLVIDESLLTGESIPDSKDSELILDPRTPLGDRENMAFAGTIVVSGRGKGVVVSTGSQTAVGGLAASLAGKPETKPPLILRMEKFNSKIALGVAVAVAVIFAVEIYRGEPIYDIFMQSVALAVAAVPEGLPVAMTVALSIGMSRMAKRNVIVRRLVAVEALGSCNFIASDKTGTLTVNQLTVTRAIIPGRDGWNLIELAKGPITAEVAEEEGGSAGSDAEGGPSAPSAVQAGQAVQLSILKPLARASVLANEAFSGFRDGKWEYHGDAVDVALLMMALEGGITQQEEENNYPKDRPDTL